jgi:hypothetical protein
MTLINDVCCGFSEEFKVKEQASRNDLLLSSLQIELSKHTISSPTTVELSGNRS